MNIFNAAEVIDIGIEKEKLRRDFYGRVAKVFKEKEMVELFTRLRDWEETHIKKFSEIRISVKEDEPTESFGGELSSYMRALVEDKLYAEVAPDNFSRNVKAPVSAVNYAMSFERDAILFFGELLPMMEPANREAVLKLVDEEKQHLVYLAELKRKLY
jgi:rubrerythrin